jgi:hypothetical protein
MPHFAMVLAYVEEETNWGQTYTFDIGYSVSCKLKILRIAK